MGVFDKASLALVPDGIKDGKLYSIKPTDGSGDFTFTRGSNLAATRVDENGLIEKGRENLLKYSEQFDNSYYLKSLGTLTVNQTTAPDGSLTADLFTKTSAVNTVSDLRGQNSIYPSTGVFTLSVYVKQNVGDTVLLRLDAAGNTANAIFQFSTKSISPAGLNVIDATATELADGWFRLSITGNVTSTAWFLSIINLFSNPTNDSVFVWGAQLEQGLVATDYIETGATTAQAGILEDLPRIDYSGSTPSLLMEPSRTNVVTNSEYFDGWVKQSGATVDTNVAISPDGTMNASRINFAADYLSRVEQGITITSGVDYTASFYLKSESGEFNVLIMGGATSNITKTVTVTEEWQRFEATDTSSGTQAYFQLRNSGSDAKSVLVYGAQFEQGSYPTSYIPTYGASATRGMDTSNNTSVGSTGEYFSVFVDYSDFSNGSLSGDNSMVFKDSSDNTIFALWGLNDGFHIRSLSGDSNGNYYTNNPFGKTAKAVVRYDGSNIDLFIDGVKQTITSPSPAETNWNQIDNINLLRASDNKYNLKQFLIFPEALSDAECITLTT